MLNASKLVKEFSTVRSESSRSLPPTKNGSKSSYKKKVPKPKFNPIKFVREDNVEISEI